MVNKFILPVTYAATFSAIAASAAQDVFEIVAPSGAKVAIREIVLGQYSDFGDAEAELLSLLMLRGYTTSGSGGASVTPSPLRSGEAAASSTVERNNTTVASSGSPVTLRSESFNVAAGYRYYPVPEERIILAPSERFVVRITAPADAITLNGTLVFDEIG
jgi:hypothetical protein